MDGRVLSQISPTGTGEAYARMSGEPLSMLMVDPQGHTIWRKHYVNADGYDFPSMPIGVTDDGDAILWLTKGKAENEPYQVYFDVVRVAQDGSVVWGRRIITAAQDHLESLQALRMWPDGEDGMFLLADHSRASMHLHRLNSAGEQLWSTELPVQPMLSRELPSTMQLFIAPDGMITLAAVKHADGHRIHVARIHPSGAVLWYERIGMIQNPTEYIYPIPVVTDDGNLYLLTWLVDMPDQRHALMKLGVDGDLEWVKWFEEAAGITLHREGRVLETGQLEFGDRHRSWFDLDGAYLGSEIIHPVSVQQNGHNYSIGGEALLWNEHLVSAGSLVKTDTLFGTIWRSPAMSRVPLDLADVCDHALATYDATQALDVPLSLMVMENEMTPGPSMSEVVVSVITVEDLMIDPATDQCTITHAPGLEWPHVVLDVFPNPALPGGPITVSHNGNGRLELYDPLGASQQTWAATGDGNTIIRTDQLASGIYLLVFRDRNGQAKATARLLISD